MTPSASSLLDQNVVFPSPDAVTLIQACLDREWQVMHGGGSDRGRREQILELMVRLLEIAIEQCPDLTVLSPDVARAAAVLARKQAIDPEDIELVLTRCRTGIVPDTARLVWQDPFSLRHVLAAGAATPEMEMVLADLAIAVARNDARAVHTCFVSLGRAGRGLGSLAPVRELFRDCARDNLPGFWPFAFELAVLETRLHGEHGWELGRAFVALVAQLEPACTASIRDYLNVSEIESALRVFKMNDDRIPAWHFDLLRRTWTSDALTHLRKLVRMRASIPLEPVAQPVPEAASPEDSAPAVKSRPWRGFWRRFAPRRRIGALVLAGA